MNLPRLVVFWFMLVAFLVSAPAGPAAAVVIDWVLIGNPFNPQDNQKNCSIPAFTNCGSVGYSYHISKYETTNAQYAEFLNAVDPNGTNTLGLYSSQMGIDTTNGGINFVSGNAAGSMYVVKSGFADKPVVYVSFFDALRFANWLNNGQGSASTEVGAYTLSNGVIVWREPGATIFIPSENEWYKAAYYDPATSSYLAYPAGSNTPTTCAGPGSTPNTANCNSAVGALTAVGAYTGSASPYGTYDQGGNAGEWNEQLDAVCFLGCSDGRAWRGGTFGQSADALAASWPLSNQIFIDPRASFNSVGFRVARNADIAIVLESNPAALVRIDTVTGSQTVLSSGGMLPAQSAGSTYNAAANLLYVTGRDISSVDGRLIFVDPSTGAQTVFFAPLGPVPTGIAIEWNGVGDVLFADAGVGENPSGGALFHEGAGIPSVLAQGGYLDAIHPWAVQIDQSGNAIVSGPSPTGGSVIRVNPVTGQQTLIASVTTGHFYDFALSGNTAYIAVGSPGPANTMDHVDKLDLTSGQLTTLFGGLQRVLDVKIDSQGRLVILDACEFLSPCGPPVVYRSNNSGGLDVVSTLGSVSTPARLTIIQPRVAAIPAQIEIEPFGPKNPIFLNQSLEVAVLGSNTVDATQIEATTLRFGPKSATPLSTRIVTVNGQNDLIAVFNVPDTGLDVGDYQACLQGATGSGIFRGCDAVTVAQVATCGLGAEPALILPALLWLRGRRRSKRA